LRNSDEFLIATSNKGKLKEFKKLFSNYKIFSLDDFAIKEPIEDGDSFYENALIKAKHGAYFSKKFTIADDSGLVIPDLNFEPGIFSARYAGKNATDKNNRDKVIRKILKKNKEELDAYYVCILIGLRHENDTLPIICEGKVHGKISINSSGDGGFGYDKIFYPDGFSSSMASLDEETKNIISHRAIASLKFIKALQA
tara:strand:- start:4707 stop:5300 length:594 start_codon:yes stop_codon:yes gene_type:complete